MEWYYKQEADLTIGEKKLPVKIIAAVAAIALVVLTTIAIVFNTQFVDLIINPTVTLKQDSVVLDINKKFNAKDYITTIKNKRIKVQYPKLKTNKPLKTTVYYISKNSMRTTKIPLQIEVKDISAPKITLKEKAIVVKRSEKASFNPADYIASVKDNYDKNVTATFTKDLNFEKEKLEVIYTAKDKAGNESHATLVVVTYGADEEKPTVSESGEVERPSAPAASNSTPSYSGGSSSSGGASSSGPYINGVHNISVPVNTAPSVMLQKLILGVQGSGYVSCNYNVVNLQVPGTYTVTFSSSDGVTKTAYVTVTP